MFIWGGLDAVRNPESKVKAAEAVTLPLSTWVSVLPDDPAVLIRVNGAVQVGAGVLLATGRVRRLAALVLIGSIIPTTYAGHRFWEETDGVTRAQQRTHFLKNLGLLGGLILAVVDTEGAPSLEWRTKRQARRVMAAATMNGASSTHGVHQVAAKASRGGRRAGRRAKGAAARAAEPRPT